MHNMITPLTPSLSTVRLKQVDTDHRADWNRHRDCRRIIWRGLRLSSRLAHIPKRCDVLCVWFSLPWR
ncbi:hypothetical protein CFP56_031865 [Quercus suber]|uniref:Uncharacterized protein n=1 Tax=Quercus suber TaxID=58331 RepID=A0AAW0LVG0_QUESU